MKASSFGREHVRPYKNFRFVQMAAHFHSVRPGISTRGGIEKLKILLAQAMGAVDNIVVGLGVVSCSLSLIPFSVDLAHSSFESDLV